MPQTNLTAPSFIRGANLTTAQMRDRKEYILRAAIAVASSPGGWAHLTRFRIAQMAGCSDALVSRYLGDMQAVKRAIMRTAVRESLLPLIAQSLCAQDGYAARCPEVLRRKALNTLVIG